MFRLAWRYVSSGEVRYIPVAELTVNTVKDDGKVVLPPTDLKVGLSNDISAVAMFEKGKNG